MAGLSGIILAGGLSRRMGVDKRRLLVDDVPLLRRAIEAVARVADDLVVVDSRRSELPPDLLDGRVHVACDWRDDAGPLAGVEAGIAVARGDLALVVAGDAPWLQPALLTMLAATLEASPGADGVVVGTSRGREPLVAAYRRSVAAAVTELLDRGERRMDALLDMVTVLTLDEATWRRFDPEGRSLVNVNTPTDLALELTRLCRTPGSQPVGASPS